MINTLGVLSNTLPAHTLKIQEVRDASRDAIDAVVGFKSRVCPESTSFSACGAVSQGVKPRPRAYYISFSVWGRSEESQIALSALVLSVWGR